MEAGVTIYGGVGDGPGCALQVEQKKRPVKDGMECEGGIGGVQQPCLLIPGLRLPGVRQPACRGATCKRSS
jgi:hypothetical protein